MKAIKIISKIGFLLGKLNNPPYFGYLVFHYLKQDMPVRLATHIYHKNVKDYLLEEKEFFVQTYDCSNQAVHPDMCFYEDKYWLVITPYPYGMEEYENPSIYCGDALLDLTAIKHNPIERPRKHEIGFHLSDPCIFDYNNQLICAYRENTREDGLEHTYIFLKEIGKEGNIYDSILVTHSVDDSILSPAFYVSNDRIYMLHVRRKGNDSVLVHSELNKEFHVIKSEVQACHGIDEGFYIWHIAVSYYRGMKNATRDNEETQGLFLLRNKEYADRFKLYYARKTCNSNWECIYEIIPPKSIAQNMRHPYKSCFVPNTDLILYSYIDLQNRYRMTMFEAVEFKKFA